MNAPVKGRVGKRLFALCFVVGCILFSRSVSAELVIMVDGAVLKAASVEVRDSRVAVELPGGGRLQLSLLAIERIVDDEVVPESELNPLLESSPPLPLRFMAGQQVGEVPFASTIQRAAERHGVHPELVAAVIAVESRFQPRAVSPKGARGLMQLMPATAKRFGVQLRELFDPERNVDAGVRYLRFLLDRYEEDLTKVLAGYNAGEGAVDRYGGVPPYRETQNYVVKVSEEFHNRLASPSSRSTTRSVQSSSRRAP